MIIFCLNQKGIQLQPNTPPPSVALLSFAEEALVMLLENSGNGVLGQVSFPQLRRKASSLPASPNVRKIHQLNTQSTLCNPLRKWLSSAWEPWFVSM